MKITIKNLQKSLPVTRLVSARIKRAILKACSSEAVKKPAEVTVCLVDNKLIRELNLNYLAQPHPTDVIAFDFAEKRQILADIVISTEAARLNARRFKTDTSYELLLYAVHGMLHVLGYDDANRKKRKLMQDKAEAILEKICPYKKPKR